MAKCMLFVKNHLSLPGALLAAGVLATPAYAAEFSTSFDHIRLEAEIGYQRNDADKIIIDSGIFIFRGNYSVTSYMANGYYDFKGDTVTPYLTAGIGLAQVTIHNEVNPPNTISKTYSLLGYQFGAGIAFPVTNDMVLDARYRYFGTSPMNLIIDNGNFKVPGNTFLIGLKFTF